MTHIPVPDLSGIDRFKRIQNGWRMKHAFPSRAPFCACGCGRRLTGRQRKWGSRECGETAYRIFAIHAGYTHNIRWALWRRDRGICVVCGELSGSDHGPRGRWEADHIIPVIEGGGGCGLENFQTLCIECHKEKTRGR